MKEDRRSHYRITFPEEFRPTLVMKMGTFEVIDLSAFGIRFDGKQRDWTQHDEPLEIVISFPDGDQANVSGRIVRTIKNEVVVLLSSPLPGRKLVALQRAIVQRYKRYLRD